MTDLLVFNKILSSSFVLFYDWLVSNKVVLMCNVSILGNFIFSERYLLVSGSADREHFDSLGSRTDLLGCTSVSDVGVSIGLVLPERVLHGVLVR